MKNYEQDLYTSTVDGAASYEKSRAKIEWMEECYDIERDDEEYKDEDEDDCKCSDPGCPCSGYKYYKL